MKPEITIEQFEKILPLICDAETVMFPARWTPDNPLKNHCAVVSLIAQNLFGGELMRAVMADGDSHYWNRLPDGTEKDFTKSQFGHAYPELSKTRTQTREYILFDPNTGEPREIMKRYELLMQRLIEACTPKEKKT